MEFGVSTHLSAARPLDAATLAAIKRHGFDAVEVFALAGHVDYETDAGAAALAGWLADAGVRLHSVHAPIAESLADGAWGRAYSTAAADSARRQEAIDQIRRTVAYTARAGGQYVIVHPGVPEAMAEGARDNDVGALIKTLDALDEEAADAGITLAVEVIPAPLGTADAVADLLDGGDRRAAGVCLDFGHAHLLGGVVDAIETVGEHLVTTHVHDNRRTQDDHLFPFDGTIDWPSAVMAMQKIGYDGVWMFELKSVAADAIDAALARAAEVRARLEALQYTYP